MNPEECSFHYVYKEEEAPEFCKGCDGLNKRCAIFTPLKMTKLWEDYVKLEKVEVCALYKHTKRSAECSACGGIDTSCPAYTSEEEWWELIHEEERRRIDEDVKREQEIKKAQEEMGKCD